MKKTLKTGAVKPKSTKPAKGKTNLSYEKLDPKLAKKTGRTNATRGC